MLLFRFWPGREPSVRRRLRAVFPVVAGHQVDHAGRAPASESVDFFFDIGWVESRGAVSD